MVQREWTDGSVLVPTLQNSFVVFKRMLDQLLVPLHGVFEVSDGQRLVIGMGD